MHDLTDWYFADFAPFNALTVYQHYSDKVNGKFRTPTLRSLPLTGLYIHNGSIATLEEAIRFYRPATFEVNDENFDKTIPESISSGLLVGGNIQ